MEIISKSGLKSVEVLSGNSSTVRIGIDSAVGGSDPKLAYLDFPAVRELIGALQDALPEAPQLSTWEVSPEVHAELLLAKDTFISLGIGEVYVSSLIRSMCQNHSPYPKLEILMFNDPEFLLKLIQYLQGQLSIAVKKAPTYTLYDNDSEQYVSEISIEGCMDGAEVYIDWEHIPELIFKDRSHAESLLKVAQEFGHLHDVEVVEVP